jgi:uncharacterized integral membrane protein
MAARKAIVEKKKDENAAKKANAKAAGQTQQKKEEGKSRKRALEYIAVVVIILAIIYLAYFVITNMVSTTFPTFKTNFDASPRVAIAVTYNNMTQFIEEEPCFTAVINTIAHTRNATTIDFFILNQTNCTYSSTGLGKPVNISVVSASRCIAAAKSEVSLFLNYSAYNKTIITPYHIYIYGNSGYMASCPIDAELT